MAILARFTNNSSIMSDVPVRKVALTDIIDQSRSRDLLRRESYYRCTQHKTKQYDFDGNILKYGEENVDIPADGYIPMKRRRPSIRMDLPKVIVERFTTLVFGHEHFPGFSVTGDADAEDFIKALAKAAKLPTKMVEARNIGGATGTAVLSWGFVEGKPLIDVHQPAFVEVLEWRDYDRRRPAKVLKSYPFEDRVWTNDGKPEKATFYYARYWDQNVDITWHKIPEELAKTPKWWTAEATTVDHETGYCPVYWIQNLPDSSSADGVSDFEAQEDDCDAIDVQLSATHKGTVANVDPTLVIHDSQMNNEGVIHKGSEHAIYSEKGAAYLELAGTAIEASVRLLDRLRQYELDKASCVLLDPDDLTGSGISAAAMRTRYAPMLAKADLLRGQYGEAIVDILDDMITVARQLRIVQTDEDGVKYWSAVRLPPRITEDKDEETGDVVVTVEERSPGSGGQIELAWPPYFAATWEDRKEAVSSVKEGAGGQQVMSKRTAVATLSPLFGTDVDGELDAIEEDVETMDRRAHGLLERGAPVMNLQGGDNAAIDDDNDDDGDEGDFDDVADRS